MPPLPFHYIITIHNKESLLPAVLEGISRCARPGAVILPVLDGCTDGSEAVVRSFAQSASVEVRPVITPDVHEIRAINAGLRGCGPGFVVVLQDDVILRDIALEERLRELREVHQKRLGYVSLRMGGKLGTEKLRRRLRLALQRRGRFPSPTLDVIELVGSPFDTHPVAKTRVLAPGEFCATGGIYKSPVCLMPELRAVEPLLDEALAPYACDDIDLSVRALRHGLTNGVYALDYASEVDWGGTRKSTVFAAEFSQIVMRNRTYLWRKHRDFLTRAGRGWLHRY